MKELLSPVWTHLTEIEAVRGEGAYLYDQAGNQYLDFTSGIGVINTGHCHPKVVEAVQQQASQLLFGQMNCVIPQKSVELAAKLNEITPPHINRFFFSNSGAEATEACVKLAKAATGKTNVIVFQGSFHGRTHLAMAMTTSKTVYRHKYHPLPSGIFVAPFPNAYHFGWTEEETTSFCLKQLEYLLKSQTAPDETAAIIIEPILGEGGYVPAPLRFIRALRDICNRHNILLILDEVQSGFGRTGRFFCYEYSEIDPDIIVMAKGLGSGLPISGIASTEELMSRWTPGTHGGTYGGGSAIAAAAACATIDTIIEDDLVSNAQTQGEYLMDKLLDLQRKHPIIGDVRGKGLMIGTEFTDGKGNPAPQVARQVLSHCLQNRLLMLPCGTNSNTIRWIPPLIVNQQQIDDAFGIFSEAVSGLVSNVTIN